MDRTPIARGRGNELCNRDEDRASREIYDIYVFLHEHPTIAENRCINVLRAAIASTPFVYAFSGLVSVAAAATIDQRIAKGMRADLCLGMQRDHFIPWIDTGKYFLRGPLVPFDKFWPEMKRRNEVALLLKEEHNKLARHQKNGHGYVAYQMTGTKLWEIDKRAITLSGQKPKCVTQYWPSADLRKPYAFEQKYGLFGAE